MNIRTIAIASIVGALALTGVAFAGAVGISRAPITTDQQAQLARLEASRQYAARQMMQPRYNKGPLLVKNMDRVSKLDDLIARMKSGEQVAPEEIDRALQ